MWMPTQRNRESSMLLRRGSRIRRLGIFDVYLCDVVDGDDSVVFHIANPQRYLTVCNFFGCI
jgi:hypothetical protein